MTAAVTTLAGLPNAGEVVGWAFGAEPGDVSNPFRIDNNYVIATLVQVNKAGVPPLENVEAQMRAGALKEKKAERYAELMNGGSLEEIAEAIGSTVKTASSLNLKSPSIAGAGGSAEPDVVGAAFSGELNSISAPIQGANGVWVIVPTVRNEVDASGTFESETNTLNDRTYFRNLPESSGAPVRLSKAMEAKADIEDLRQGS